MKPVERLCSNLDSAIAELRSQGFRIETIYPADEPHSATLSRGSETVRLSTRPDSARPASALPEFHPEFVLTRGGDSGSGRAGMRYRDLIPGRLGGRFIASAVTIEEGGPVSDWVHYHRLAFQMIFVRRGWVRVVYEDQGAPFVLNPGDMVLQPPGIRHRVLESSPRLEVVEISCPALHETCADHELELPTAAVAPDRSFGGQKFVRHVAAEARWTSFVGGEAQDSGIAEATGGLAEVRIVRPAGSARLEFDAHHGELAFGFVLDGRARLVRGDGVDLAESDAFVIPPGEPWCLIDVSADFRLLHVATAPIGENGLAAGD
ncbi:MAG TPA: cupin domain-containing protein [Sphingomicrobium sp.]